MKKRGIKKNVLRKVAEKKKSQKKVRKGEKILNSKEKIKKNVSNRKLKTKSSQDIRISTGISGFDSLIEGGFEDHSINLLGGGSGSGKTIFVTQFLIEGIKRKEKTLFVTFEEKKEDFYEDMKKFGWDLQKAENEGNFVFLEYSPEKVKQMLDEGGGAIESIVLKYNIDRLVIDSITSFSLMFDDELSRRQAILNLFDIIRKWKCTTLITVQHNPSSSKDRGMSDAEFEADSITLLYFIKVGSKRNRFIEVLKMRGTNHSKELHSFIIKKGILIGKPAKVKIFGEE